MTAISANTAEGLLHDLVAIPSPSREEQSASEFLVRWMSEHGYDEAFVDDAGNAVGIIGNGEREIVLLGHIDTFPGFPDVHINGRTLYGRGSVDAKGPLCTFSVAAGQAQLDDNVRVVVIGATEEEAATSKGARFAATQYQPNLCVIGEPSYWDRITLGYKGRLLLDWHWEGGMSHSAGDALSPAEHAVGYWQTVKAYADEYNADITSIFTSFDASIRDINTHLDGVNGVADMTIGFRLPPNVTPQEVIDRFPSTNGAIISPRGGEVAFTGDKNSELSRLFRRAIRANEGKPRFLYKTGTADMNVVGPVWNCPIVAYGPGDSSLDHTPHEHIDLDEYLRAISVLTHVLEAL